MASPPFTINEAIPANNDFISQHPTGARDFRDIVESWLLTISDSSGNVKVSALAENLAEALGDLGVDPPGVVNAFAGTSVPTGWLICDGSAVSRSTYADLFSAIGTTYGVGDGSTTFNVPDIRGRVIAGQDDMGGSSANRLTDQSGGVDGDTLGDTGGAETHTLTVAQLAAHNHTLTDPGHTHQYERYLATQVVAGGASFASMLQGSQFLNTGSRTTGITIDSAGSGNAHNNVQPTIILNYIIRT